MGQRLTEKAAVWKDAARALWRDGGAVLRHGRQAPRFREVIRISPAAVREMLTDDGLAGVRSTGAASGTVRAGDWDRHTVPIESWTKLKQLRARFDHGLSWEEAGVYDRMMALIARNGRTAGCTTLEEVKARYARVDRIFEEISRTGRLRTPAELGQAAFRGADLSVIHFTRDGRPIFRGGGGHRLCLAIIAGLPEIPAQVGFVHPDALPFWRDRLADQLADPAAACAASGHAVTGAAERDGAGGDVASGYEVRRHLGGRSRPYPRRGAEGVGRGGARP